MGTRRTQPLLPQVVRPQAAGERRAVQSRDEHRDGDVQASPVPHLRPPWDWQDSHHRGSHQAGEWPGARSSPGHRCPPWPVGLSAVAPSSHLGMDVLRGCPDLGLRPFRQRLRPAVPAPHQGHRSPVHLQAHRQLQELPGGASRYQGRSLSLCPTARPGWHPQGEQDPTEDLCFSPAVTGTMGRAATCTRARITCGATGSSSPRW